MQTLGKIYGATLLLIFLFWSSPMSAQEDPKQKAQPPTMVRVAQVAEKTVSDQISLVASTEPIAESTVAAEAAGVVEAFPVKEGDVVRKGDLLAQLKTTESSFRLRAAKAARERIAANLENAEKELARLSRLKAMDSIAERGYEVALYSHRALSAEIHQNDAQIELLEYEIAQKQVRAPFAGLIAREHTQVGEWIQAGGPVVTLIDTALVRITVDVPERYAFVLSPKAAAGIVIKSLSDQILSGKITAILPQGDPAARTFPVRITLANPGYKIKSGMEALVTFELAETKKATLVPKDAVISQGAERMVYAVADGRAQPVMITILGYYDGNVAVAGQLKSGDTVVIRGNERLRPGQPVAVMN